MSQELYEAKTESQEANRTPELQPIAFHAFSES
jgi:hypothetical protein